ncbi:hypothetical protein EGW08_010302 [Elysia chlorotica]|uniref:Uncharacterized protein n=1 Tax=Elysia chlorotica TaxID=188477 RepID=A0A3S1BIZ9_ELYCH|nr:hypothetical protein EGW08_010302 [Elysia chlorotica]
MMLHDFSQIFFYLQSETKIAQNFTNGDVLSRLSRGGCQDKRLRIVRAGTHKQGRCIQTPVPAATFSVDRQRSTKHHCQSHPFTFFKVQKKHLIVKPHNTTIVTASRTLASVLQHWSSGR